MMSSTTISAFRIFLLFQFLLSFCSTSDAFISPSAAACRHYWKTTANTDATTHDTISKKKKKKTTHQPETFTRSSSTSSSQLQMVWKTKDPQGMAMDFPKTKTRFVATLLATLFTWHGITFHGMNPVLSSAVTTLAITMWSPGLGQAAYCGSFAGMGSAGSYGSTALIALLNAILFEVVVHRENKWLGLGGRLGVIAFVTCNLVADIVFGSPHAILQVPLSIRQWWTVLLQSPWLYCMMCGAAGSVATIVLREVAENASNIDNDLRDPVRASAVIGLFAALGVGMKMGSKTLLDNFGALLVYGGAFTGMSLPSRLLTGVVPGSDKNQHRTPPGAYSIVLGYAVAGALGGLVHALTVPLQWWTGGIWGGKAGACAFLGVCLYRGLEKVVFTIRQSLGWIKSKSSSIELNGGGDQQEEVAETKSAEQQ